MYLLTYIIDENGRSFYNKLLKNIKKEEIKFIDNFLSYYNKNYLLETCLFNENISVDLTNNIVFIYLDIKYSSFLNSKEIQKRIELFEKKFCKILGGSKFYYRIDEFLLENNSDFMNNDDSYKNENAFINFSLWLNQQEELHWCKIKINRC